MSYFLLLHIYHRGLSYVRSNLYTTLFFLNKTYTTLFFLNLIYPTDITHNFEGDEKREKSYSKIEGQGKVRVKGYKQFF
jgi:hypothetical protein